MFKTCYHSITVLETKRLYINQYPQPIKILYCDTGVEQPVIRDFVGNTLYGVADEAMLDGIPIEVTVAKPALEDSFFVKVIGRGYLPPTNKFRWCTDQLRINPVKRILDSNGSDVKVVLLGIRKGESLERDRIISKHKTTRQYYLKQSGNPNVKIFSPIIQYTTRDVWQTLMSYSAPQSLDCHRLLSLYRQANGECPILRDSNSLPCGKGRFGCWTCTVVRRDLSSENLIQQGWNELIPLLAFRDYMNSIRDDIRYRCRQRRNGVKGLGPLTLEARRILLEKLLRIQEIVPWSLISKEELNLVHTLWQLDQVSDSYVE